MAVSHIFVAIKLIALIYALIVPSSQTPSTLPNIVFMMADDLGYGDVSYNGGRARTPNLDEMAVGPNTIHLTRYYSGAPVCSPTRGTLLTGRNHNRYCMWYANVGSDHDDFAIPQRMPLPDTELTVAEVLKSAGYQTAMYGKWHLGDLKRVDSGNQRWPVSHPGMHGFDKWLVTERSAPTHHLNCACFNNTASLCQPLGHYTTLPPCSNYYSLNDSSTDTLEAFPTPIRGDDNEFILEKFSEFLTSAVNQSNPFFVYLAFHTVHHRYIASPQNAQEYLSLHYDRNHADYYGSITAMDSAIGGVRRLLRSNNVSHNTMLWFTSDNGPLGSTPGDTAGLRGSKGSLYEGGIRVPGLIEWPAVITQNRLSDFPVVSSDLLPTVSDIVHRNISERVLDGISLLPMLKGEQHTRNSSIKWAFKIPANFSRLYQAALSNDRYKLHATYDNDNIVSASLFDLRTDPHETVNLMQSQRGLFESLKHELENWRQSVVHSAKYEVQCYGNSTDYFFECDDRTLIPFNKQCNGHADCVYGTDEIHCVDCWPDAFHCENNRCIQSSAICNGRNNCGDGSDETCKLCLPSQNLCDGVSHCSDSSDEAFCGVNQCVNCSTIPGPETSSKLGSIPISSSTTNKISDKRTLAQFSSSLTCIKTKTSLSSASSSLFETNSPANKDHTTFKHASTENSLVLAATSSSFLQKSTRTPRMNTSFILKAAETNSPTNLSTDKKWTKDEHSNSVVIKAVLGTIAAFAIAVIATTSLSICICVKRKKKSTHCANLQERKVMHFKYLRLPSIHYKKTLHSSDATILISDDTVQE